VYDYILYYILAYIQHNRNVWLENPKVVTGHTSKWTVYGVQAICCAGLASCINLEVRVREGDRMLQ